MGVKRWWRYGAAALAGVGWALSFPKASLAGLAWLVPAAMVAIAAGRRAGEAFRLGYVAGLAQQLVGLSWLLNIPAQGYPILGWIALSAFLALFPAVWLRLTAVTCKEPGRPGRSDGWPGRTLWALSGAAAWVALEMVQARALGGFPWNLLGASQYALLPLIQMAAVTGVYGVSFVVAWTSLALFCAGRETLRRPTERYAWLGELLLPGLVIGALFAIGWQRLQSAADGGRELRVTVVQPSIPQTLIWDARENRNRFGQLIELSQRALAEPTDLLVWPEAAVPEMVRHDPDTRRAVTDLARARGVWIILGSDDAALRPGGRSEADVEYYNAGFLINPEGNLVASYRKNHLVMFGEFVPLARWWPMLRRLTPISGEFTPGTKAVPFSLERRPSRAESLPPATAAPEPPGPAARVTAATVICFEDVFPHLVRRHVTADTDLLVNLTNDGWFGQSAAQWQHAASAAFRALENGVPLLRCCNNGLTCWVDARGRWRAVFRDAEGSEYGPGWATWRIALPEPARRSATTFYNRHGDWLGWACVVATLARVASRVVLRRRQKLERRNSPAQVSAA